MKRFCVFNLCLALFIILSNKAFSQNFIGVSADKLVKGTNEIVVNEKTKTIDFIKMQDDFNVAASDPTIWLNNSLKLSSAHSFILKGIEKDHLGYSHIKYQLCFNKIPVDGFVYIVHTFKEKIISANGKVANYNAVSTLTNITESQAHEIALLQIPSDSYEKGFGKDAKGILTFLVINETYKLVYKFDIYSLMPLKHEYIFVDAETGEIISIENRIRNSDAIGSAVTKYNGTRTITTDYTGSSYRLRENGRGNGIITYNNKNSTSASSAVDFTNATNTWNLIADKACYDAHFGTEVTYDYFKNNFGRNSIDNAGFQLISYTHYGSQYDNAFWDGMAMHYGDGYDYTAFTSLDIVAHEITHGLTEKTADLIYSNESGALNESFSDIFGIAVDFYANPTTANFKNGEQISPSGIPIRDVSNPSSTGNPDTYKGLNWSSYQEVHQNSTVQSYCFYLMCVGGSGVNDLGNSYNVTGFGIKKAEQIAFRTLAVYLTANATYNDARTYFIQSAKDLYGACSAEVIATTNAWHAVGVGSVFSNSVDANFSTNQTYFCTLPAIVHFTNSSINSTTYKWDFGDGTTSTLANPSHTYTIAGDYTVSLISNGTATCGGTSDTIIKSNYLIVKNAGAPVTPSCKPSTVYTGYSYGILNFVFNTITNTTIGSDGYQDYTCSKSTTISEGSDYNYSVTTGTSNSAMIKIWVDLNNDGQFANATELLVDKSTNYNTTLTGTVSIPHTSFYNTPLRLRVASDAAGSYFSDACTVSQYGQYEDYTVIVQQNILPPHADFEATPIGVNPGQSVYFKDLSTHIPTSWQWTFVGGTPSTSTLQSPTVTYNTVGVYSVFLKVINANGNDTLTKLGLVNVSNSFKMCSNANSNSVTGIIYDSGGELGSYNNNDSCNFLIDPGCAKSIALNFISFNTESCCDHLRIYDGSNTGGLLLLDAVGSSIPASVIANTGKMYLTFTTDGSVVGSGFKASWTSVINAETSPVADFLISNINSPLKTNVQFTDVTASNPLVWFWNFGDGNTSVLKNPTHAYLTSGTFTVTLIVANCTNSDTISKTVTIQQAPLLIVNPTSLSATINSCNDSISVPLKIKNTGLGQLNWNFQNALNVFDDFDPAIDNTVWQTINGGVASNVCGFYSAPNALYFNSSSLREAITKPINTIAGGSVSFYLEIGSSASGSCEQADNGEDVLLYYSINGGTTWTIIKTYYTGNYITPTLINETIPALAKSSSTMFKWAQPVNSGLYYDNWSIDNVTISAMSNSNQITPSLGILNQNDSITVNVTFKSKGLNSGTINSEIILNSNDPTKPQLIVPCSLLVNGTPQNSLSKSSINFGTLMQFATKKDSVVIKNKGCSNLIISSITSTNAAFTISPTTKTIAPNDSTKFIITFTPTTVGAINATLTIDDNVRDTVISLSANAVGAPIVSVAPTILSATINSCNDSISVPLKIKNTGLGQLNWNFQNTLNVFDDFDPAIDNSVWQTINGGVASNVCGFYSAPNALYFNSSSLREAITKPINTIAGGSVSFYLEIGSSASGSCEQADTGEDVLLYYSINGGTTWTIIKTYYTGNYITPTLINETIPALAQSSSTMFKWAQPVNSGLHCDNWSIDNVTISAMSNSNQITPSLGTLNQNDSITVNVSFKSKGLNSGTINSEIILNSNDPTKPQLIVPCSLLVNGTPQNGLSKSSIHFGTLMQFATKKDSVVIKNKGCTNLIISSITSTNAAFTISPTTKTIAPNDSTKFIITFTPTTVGAINATLTIDDNVRDTVIILSANAVGAPIASVVPAILSATINSCNDSISVPLKIKNTGLSALNYNVLNKTTVSKCEVLVYNYDPSHYSNIILALNQYYTNYNLSTTSATTAINLQTALIGKNVFLVPETSGADSYFTLFSTVLNNFVSNGGTVVFCGSYIPYYIFNSGLFTGTLYSSTDDVNANVINNKDSITSGFPSTILLKNGSYTLNITNSDNIKLVTYDGYDVVSYRNIGMGRAIYLAYDYYDYDNYSAKLLSNSVRSAIGGVSWIKATPTTGSVPQNDSTIINVKFYSKGLNNGTTTSQITINTNDPAKPQLIVPCSLIVNGSAVNLPSKRLIDLGTVFNNDTKIDSIVIRNKGCVDLIISNITTTNTAFTVTPKFNIISPNDSITLVIQFSPTTIGTYSALLNIYDNAHNDVLNLTATVIGSPFITVNPTSFDVTLNSCNDSITFPLTINNTGQGTLNYIIQDHVASNKNEVLVYRNNTYNVTNTLVALGEHYSNYNLTETYATTSTDLQIALNGKNVFLVPTVSGETSYFASFATVMQSFVNNGGTVIFCGSYNPSYIFSTGLFSGSFYSSEYGTDADVINTTDSITYLFPSTINMEYETDVLNITNTGVTRLVTYNGYDVVAYRTIGKGKAVYLGFDYYYYDYYSSMILSNAVRMANSGMSKWIRVSDVSGIVNQGKFRTIDVKFKSTGLNRGTYNSNIIFNTNDPLHLSLNIPCTLNVLCCLTSDFNAFSDGCNGMVVFESKTTNNPTSFKWNFGDGSYSSEQSPSHTYKVGGKYNVTLIASNASCSDTLTKSVTVEKLSASFTTSGNLKTNEFIEFINSDNDAIYWNWNFGDSSYSLSRNPKHAYATAKKYNVSLLVLNKSGCEKTITKQLIIGSSSGNSENQYQQVNIYPNPNDGKFNLTINTENKGVYIISVLGSDGRLLYETEIEKTIDVFNGLLDLSILSDGQYIINVKSLLEAYNLKLIIVK